MKSNSSIKTISLAAIKRHSVESTDWSKTNILLNNLPEQVKPNDQELPIVYFMQDNNNWTLLTTQRIIGKIDSQIREIKFEELDNTIWGNFKSKNIDTTIFQTIDIHGKQKEFLMETGNSSMAFIYGIKTVETFYKACN